VLQYPAMYKSIRLSSNRQVNSSLSVKLTTLLCALSMSRHFTTVQTTERELLCFAPQLTVLTHNFLVHHNVEKLKVA